VTPGEPARAGADVLSPDETDDAFDNGVVALARNCDVVRVAGRDALSYLQSQCTQDLSGLRDGGSAESLLLSPQGRVDAYVRVVRLGEHEALVVGPTGSGEAVASRLQRFRLRVKAECEQLGWPCVLVRGPGSSAVAGNVAPGVVVLPVERGRAVGFDLVGPGASVPDGVPLGDPETFAALRIESGEPLPGSEIGEKTIPQEIGVVERAVSFTKGCYPGQELVARIDARGGHVPRQLRGVLVEASGRVELPGELVLDGRVVGELTSLAWSVRAGGPVALALVRREVEPPATVVLRAGAAPSDGADGPGRPGTVSPVWPARVLRLPLAGPGGTGPGRAGTSRSADPGAGER
jgi:folate-binding protein YgfZ